LAMPVPLLATELWPLRVLRGSEGEESLQAGFEFRLRSLLVNFCLGLFFLFLLFPFRLLFLLLLGRLWFLLRLLGWFLLRLRRRGFLFFFCGCLCRLFLDVCAKTFAKVVDFAFLAQRVPFGPDDQLGFLRGADLARGRERLLGLGRRLGAGGLFRLLSDFGLRFRLRLLSHSTPPRPSS